MVKSVYDLADWNNNKDKEHLAELLECWLSMYTSEVIERVLLRINDILGDPMTMNLLEELYKREAKEKEKRLNDFEFILLCISQNKKWDADRIHNNVLEHSDSYRDILYDFYIREEI